jgi:hypothetical protein
MAQSQAPIVVVTAADENYALPLAATEACKKYRVCYRQSISPIAPSIKVAIGFKKRVA